MQDVQKFTAKHADLIDRATLDEDGDPTLASVSDYVRQLLLDKQIAGDDT